MTIRKLNSIRGVAALIVAISHFSNSTNWLGASLGSGAGQLGVTIFFLLSGFLISYLYLEKEFNTENINKYLVARISRILPLFLLVVIFSYIFNKAGIGALYHIDNLKLLASNLLLLEGAGVLWTIPPIVHFYLLFVLLWWLYFRSKVHFYIIVLASFVFIFLFGFPVLVGELVSLPYDFRLLRSLPYFLFGLIIGRIYNCWQAPRYLRSNLYVFVLFIIPLMYPKIYVLLAHHRHGMWSDMGVMIVMSLIFSSILFLVPDDTPILANKVGDFLGDISYSMYLLHTTILAITLRFINSILEVQLLFFIISTLSLSFIFYKYFEIPAAKLIRIMAENIRK